ncbi:MAG: SOS response-associated peptidase [Bauldia sp.]
MCGRYTLTATPEELQALFGYLDSEPQPPRYNIAPTQPIAIVREAEGACRLALVRWGLVPWWVEDPAKFKLLINARGETAQRTPAFRDAMRARRCLVPASGFYEWQRIQGKSKQPYWLRPRAGGLIAFAGLWERWTDRAGQAIESGCILTTTANATVAPIHDRMPVVIGPRDFDRWLSGGERAAGGELLGPPPADLLEAVPVGTRVNKVDNDDPGLIEPVPAAATGG